jgi:predicted permease
MKQSSVFWLWLLARVSGTTQSSAVAQWTQVLEPDLALLADASKDTNDREQILRARVRLVSAAAGEGALRDDYSQPLVILMTMAGLVLLVGCVNLANLQLARMLARQRELAVRTALGARRWRLLCQLFVEGALLALIGGVLAFLVGRAASSLLLHWASGRGPAIPLDMHMGWGMLVFGAALLMLALTGFSLVPGWKFTHGNLADHMKSRSSSSSSHGRIARRWSSLLLAGQVSFSLLLLGMAGLFAQTLLNLSHVNAGLDREHVISIHLDFTNAGYRETDLPELYARLITRLRELPDVRDAALQMCAIPGCIWNTAIHVSGHPEFPEKQLHGEENHVGAGYFHTMGIPILEGRDFDERDLPVSEPVAILNRTFARNLFGNESPVGHRIGYEPPPHDANYLIVGECADARVDDLRFPAPAVAYFSVNQRPRPVGTIEVRSGGPPRALYSRIRQSLLAVDSHLPITDIVALNTEYADGLSKETLLARLTGVFGFLVLALAALGFYGLLSFNVTRRTAEIGIRISIGATPAQVRALIFHETAWILFAGILPGVAFTEIMGRVVRALLYGSGPIDLWAQSFAICILIATGMLAGLIPAHRAASIDPVKALRAE